MEPEIKIQKYVYTRILSGFYNAYEKSYLMFDKSKETEIWCKFNLIFITQEMIYYTKVNASFYINNSFMRWYFTF